MSDPVKVDPRIGTVVADTYRLVRLVGQGGMGKVYEAQHTRLGRRFAVKCLHAQHCQNPEILQRFQREAEAAGSIENENIAAAIDVGVLDDGAPFLAMEFLVGEDLAHLLARSGPLPVPRAADLIVQTCRGLAAAHARDIVHRDLKPQNLFICRHNDGTDSVKVLDFGIAKLKSEVALTHTGATMGTPCYMSIEQARGAKDVDQRSDVYALGVILYEVLAGAPPYRGSSYNEVLYHVLTGEPVALQDLRRGLPTELTAIVKRAMAREPAERYQSVAELRAALARFAERTPTSASLEIGCEAIAGATMPSPGSLPVVAVSPEMPRRARVPRAAWTIGALFVMLLLALGLWRKLARESVSSLSPAPLASAPHPVALAPSAAAADASPANISVPARAEPTAVVSSHPDERPRKRPASNAIAVDSRHPASSALSASPSAPGTTTLPFDRNNPYSH